MYDAEDRWYDVLALCQHDLVMGFLWDERCSLFRWNDLV